MRLDVDLLLARLSKPSHNSSCMGGRAACSLACVRHAGPSQWLEAHWPASPSVWIEAPSAGSITSPPPPSPPPADGGQREDGQGLLQGPEIHQEEAEEEHGRRDGGEQAQRRRAPGRAMPLSRRPMYISHSCPLLGQCVKAATVGCKVARRGLMGVEEAFACPCRVLV